MKYSKGQLNEGKIVFISNVFFSNKKYTALYEYEKALKARLVFLFIFRDIHVVVLLVFCVLWRRLAAAPYGL